jgi:hypothetical protein
MHRRGDGDYLRGDRRTRAPASDPSRRPGLTGGRGGAIPKVKGTALVATERFLRERYGDEGLKRVLAALGAEDRGAIETGLLVSTWYPMELLLRLMRTAKEQLAPADLDFFRNLGRASAEYGLTTVYRIFFKIGSPQFILSKSSRMFSSYYDTGDMQVVSIGPGHAIVELVGFEGGSTEYCERIHGWMGRTMELSGARNLRTVHPLCVHRGDAVCRHEGYWD